LTVSHIVGFQL